MTEKTRNLVITSSILATSIILVFFQAPLLGMGLDLSYVALLLGRRYIGYWWTVLICLMFPWVSIGFMGPIGALFLVFQSIVIVTLDLLFNKDKYTFFGIAMVVLLGTLASVLINFVIIVPMYWWLAGETFGNVLGNYVDFSDSFIKYEFSWMVTGLIFNPIKLSLVYGISYGIWIALENSVNLEPNYTNSIQGSKEKEVKEENPAQEKKEENKE